MKSPTIPGKAEVQDRTEEIYCKAAQIFHDRGYDATSMSDLAEAMEITKAGLYYYIESKEDLLFRIISFGLDWLEKEVVEPAKVLNDAEDRLKFIIQRHGGELIKGVQAIPILTDESSSLPPKLRKQIDKRKRLYFDLTRGALDDLKRQGKLRDVDTTVATFSLFGMLLWLPRWFNRDGSLSADETLDQLTNLYFGGVLMTPSKGKRTR
ncbi:MAG: TetR/AcrR family transcriptional regulator [Pirellulaceae bacterium]|nr:TetR/AcrR family transcriptional regulator [Pirellulaceae bacterium]